MHYTITITSILFMHISPANSNNNNTTLLYPYALKMFLK